MSSPVHTLLMTADPPPPLQVTKRMLQSLAPLPATAIRLLTLLNDVNVSLLQVAEVASRDLGISASFLRMANSPIFGRRGKVGAVIDALRVIGTMHARLLVLASGVSQLAQRGAPLYELPAGSFLRHSELVANMTMTLSRQAGYPDIGLAYSAGLLHDIGKAILNGQMMQQQPHDLPRLAATMQEYECSLVEVEQRLFGIDHAQIGRQLAELWALPDDLITAITRHHDATLSAEDDLLTTCVAIANGIAGMLDSEYPALNRAGMMQLPRWVDMDQVDAMARECLGSTVRSA